MKRSRLLAFFLFIRNLLPHFNYVLNSFLQSFISSGNRFRLGPDLELIPDTCVVEGEVGLDGGECETNYEMRPARGEVCSSILHIHIVVKHHIQTDKERHM